MRDRDSLILESLYDIVFENTVGKKSWDDISSMYKDIKSSNIHVTYDTMEYWMELKRDIGIKFYEAFVSKKPLPWRKVSASKIMRVWKNFARNQYTVHERDLDILNQIKEQILYNITALHVGNLISGHSSEAPEDFIEDVVEVKMEENQLQDFAEYMQLSDGMDIVSDYGLPYLEKLFAVLKQAKTPEEELYTIDKILNVIHQRNDLASFFIEGGSNTLNKMSN